MQKPKRDGDPAKPSVINDKIVSQNYQKFQKDLLIYLRDRILVSETTIAKETASSLWLALAEPGLDP